MGVAVLVHFLNSDSNNCPIFLLDKSIITLREKITIDELAFHSLIDYSDKLKPLTKETNTSFPRPRQSTNQLHLRSPLKCFFNF